jgi:transposase-like protein
MGLKIQQLSDAATCDGVAGELRWREGVKCPQCGSGNIKKRGFHNQQAQRQRYEGQACERQFDDLTGTIFEGHHPPRRVWVLCL